MKYLPPLWSNIDQETNGAYKFQNPVFSQIKNKLTKEATRLGRIPTTETIYALLIERSRANMHVVVCMSPIGDAFRNRLRQYPALINCTTIDWFLEWPREALLEVGNKFLMNLNLTLTITGETKPVGPWGATPPPFPPPSGRSIPFDSYFSGIERETLELLEKARGGGRRGGENRIHVLSISWNPIIFLSTARPRPLLLRLASFLPECNRPRAFPATRRLIFSNLPRSRIVLPL